MTASSPEACPPEGRESAVRPPDREHGESEDRRCAPPDAGAAGDGQRPEEGQRDGDSDGHEEAEDADGEDQRRGCGRDPAMQLGGDVDGGVGPREQECAAHEEARHVAEHQPGDDGGHALARGHRPVRDGRDGRDDAAGDAHDRRHTREAHGRGQVAEPAPVSALEPGCPEHAHRGVDGDRDEDQREAPLAHDPLPERIAERDRRPERASEAREEGHTDAGHRDAQVSEGDRV
ncbi:MAG: hypothetical protein O2976_05010 [Actinomycetota bacterium]|nr:hypothetical protein [Actinomycetota bacterium]